MNDRLLGLAQVRASHGTCLVQIYRHVFLPSRGPFVFPLQEESAATDRLPFIRSSPLCRPQQKETPAGHPAPVRRWPQQIPGNTGTKRDKLTVEDREPDQSTSEVDKSHDNNDNGNHHELMGTSDKDNTRLDIRNDFDEGTLFSPGHTSLKPAEITDAQPSRENLNLLSEANYTTSMSWGL